MQVGKLLLRFGGLGSRDQRHQIRQRDQHQNTDDDQHDQQLGQRKAAETATRIKRLCLHGWCSFANKGKMDFD